MELLLVLSAALISCNVKLVWSVGRRVCTPDTCYVGGQLVTGSGGSFTSFQGIRYAEPPTDQLRLKRPVRREAGGEAELDVSALSEVVCPQWSADLTSLLGQEDCLLLNVYVPDNVEMAPVMVWIHGGAFVSGSGTFKDYGPQYFMDGGVIIVTVNYRLGPLGFLSTASEQLAGNLGLWDQSMALLWIRDNIQYFAGDPDQVTLFGESAGSTSASLHLVSSVSRDLFHQLIMQSSSFYDVSYHLHSPEVASKLSGLLLSELQCQGLPAEDCLRAATTTDIMLAALQVEGETENWGSTWMPVADFSYTLHPFLTDHPQKLIEDGAFPTDVNVIIGRTEDEGIIYLIDVLGDASLWDDFRENFNTTGTKSLFMIPFYSDITEEDVERTDRIVHFYVGSYDNITEHYKHKIIDIFTDSGSNYGIFSMINGLVAHGTKVYSYDLTYEGLHSVTNYLGLPRLGVCHGDELIYMWHPLNQLGLVLTDEDMLVKQLITEAWTNFAKSGDPTPPGSVHNWSPVGAKIANDNEKWYFNISGSKSSGMDGTLDSFRRLTFWDSLLLKYY